MNYKDKKYLFTGDIESKVENELIKMNTLEKIDILKVSHHGSNSSTSTKFLDVVSPQYAIISSGSTYTQFPNEKCLKRILEKVKVENLYLTERDGTIWVTSDGIGENTIQKLDKVNLDGAKSTINYNELNYEYLESILISMFSFFDFFVKIIEKKI